MTESVQERWGRSDNEAIRRRAHSGDKEDEVEAWLDHVQPVICRSRDHDITIAFSLRREFRRTCRCRYRYEYNLVKNLPTHWGTGEENRKTNENILAP